MAALNVDIEAGLLTKNEFYRRLDDVILDLRAPDMQQIGLAIGLLDVRALKEMNDVYAPELGDMTLFAANIALRQTASFSTRFYGDDFGGLYEINPRQMPIKTQAATRERQLELQK